MGAKQTKIEGCYLPDTPMISRIPTQNSVELQQPITVRTDFDGTQINDPLDPRSPNGCRTPISILFTPPPILQDQSAEVLQQLQQQTPMSSHENPLSMLRKRFLKGFSYNVNDPRSPNLQLNRTPLVFEDANEKTFNLNDTFSDLFVESRAEPLAEPQQQPSTSDLKGTATIDPMEDPMIVDAAEPEKENSSVEVSSIAFEEEETMPCPAKLQQTPIILQQQFDPRSPTIGVDRTPIIFTDDDEVYEDAMLENILATLSLNLSSSSSVASFTSISNVPKINESVKNSRPANKHLERVRLNGRMPKKQFKSAQKHRQNIYEDRENGDSSPLSSSTPPKKRNLDQSGCDSASKRTPLSCVKNRAHLRSRSVESSGKSQKTRLPLTSFDDSLNPVDSSSVVGLRIMQGLEDSLEL